MYLQLIVFVIVFNPISADGDYMSFGIADGKDRSVVSGGDGEKIYMWRFIA